MMRFEKHTPNLDRVFPASAVGGFQSYAVPGKKPPLGLKNEANLTTSWASPS
jgi:hypothetical protein